MINMLTHRHNHLCSSIIREKSSKHTNPSPFLSTPSIMRWHSSNVHRSSPIAWKTRISSSAEIFPSWSVSKTSNASLKSFESGSDPHAEPTRLIRASTLMHPWPSRSTSLSIIVTSSWLGGSPPSRVRSDSSSSLETNPSLSRSMSLNACTKSQWISDQSKEKSGKTLVGVDEPATPFAGLWTEDPSEEEENVPELKDGGSDLDTEERSFLERKRCLGLSLSFIGKNGRWWRRRRKKGRERRREKGGMKRRREESGGG